MNRIGLSIISLMVAVASIAQDVTIEADYPSVVESGQQFNITWTVNSGGGEWSAPAFTGFYKLMGPQTSYSSSTQMYNGKVTRQTSYTYTYFLQAINPGKYVLAPARFTLKSKSYFSDSIRIEVTGSAVPQQAEQAGADVDQEVAASNQDLFVALNLNRREVYQGESITASVKIYTRLNLSGINEIKYPSFNDFLKTDLETPPLTSLREENVNGRRYGTGVIQQFLLFPQVAGEITIDPVQLTLMVQQRSGQSDPFFGDFFSQYQTTPRVVASKPVKIKVKALPGTRPADFSGIIGKIELKASTDKDSVNVNDPVTLKIAVTGNGNLRIAGSPSLKLSPDIEVYDPKITDDIRNNSGGSSGSRTFEYLLIPRHYGDYEIPPVKYSFFNTSSGKYETLSTKPFRFHARKGTEDAGGVTIYGGMSKEDVKYLGKDIRFIRTAPGKTVSASVPLVSRKSFLAFYITGILLFIIIVLARKEHIRRNSDLSAVRNRKAGKVAVKRLKQAENCLRNGDNDMFYDEILKGIWGYLSDKLSIPLSELSRNNSVSVLEAAGVDASVVNDLLFILDTCEFARYAPAQTGSAPAEIYEKASAFIRKVENIIA
ncbi:MAG: BatD family protein [Bacteroidales bacterium]|jgi:hypothetical protein|nr:BatD family protein [Bacteroidales bacterium]